MIRVCSWIPKRAELAQGTSIEFASCEQEIAVLPRYNVIETGCSSQHGVPSMCDYSLELVASRPANVGDKLVSTGFPLTSTRGFASVDDSNVAVCLLPGTELASRTKCDAKLGSSSTAVSDTGWPGSGRSTRVFIVTPLSSPTAKSSC